MAFWASGHFASKHFTQGHFAGVGVTSATEPAPSPGAGDMPGAMPSWEWLLFIEEQKRLDEERERAAREEKTRAAHDHALDARTREEVRVAAAEQENISAHARSALLEAETKYRKIQEEKAEKALLDEMIIVGLLSL